MKYQNQVKLMPDFLHLNMILPIGEAPCQINLLAAEIPSEVGVYDYKD